LNVFFHYVSFSFGFDSAIPESIERFIEDQFFLNGRMTRVSTEVTFWHSAEYGLEQKSLQKSKNSAEFRVGGIPWTPYV
jgi:hypothetical protein